MLERVVYHYQLKDGINKISLPVGSKVVHFGMRTDDNGFSKTETIWVEQYKEVPENEKREYAFIFIGTGHPVPKPYCDWSHRGTLIRDNGLVWHLYEKGVSF